MEDYKVLIYIFGIIIYVIYMAMKKYFNPEQDHPAEHKQAGPQAPRPAFEPQKQPTPTSAPAPGPAPSFEEMMRRLGQPTAETPRQTPQQQPKPLKVPKPLRETSSEKSEKAKQKAEDVRELARAARERTQEKIDTFVSRQPRAAVSYEEQPHRLRDSLVKEPETKRGDRVALPVTAYAALLKDPASARTAFVMSEIFKQKEW